MDTQHPHRRISHIAGAVALALAGTAALPTFAEDPAPTPPAQTAPAAKAPVKPGVPAKPDAAAQSAAATAAYDTLVKAYLENDFVNLDAHLKAATKETFKLTPAQRTDLEYIRKIIPEQRPKWWQSTKAANKTSFQSAIWGRALTTNYIPDDDLGVQLTGIRDGKVVTAVVWRPTNVDNPRAADGELAKTLKVTKGDIGEVVVWHELGHLFITSQMSPESVYELYTKFELLYSHLQEFYGDMTAIFHCTPHARRIALVLRLDLLDPPWGGKYREMEPHTRGAHAIGSMLLAEVLSDLEKYPNIHLPPAVPESEVELKTIVYMYEHFTTAWTLAEDKAMRDWAQKIITAQGNSIFRSKGMIQLPDKNTFSLMEAQDREFQAKRDAWVTEKLKKAIASGRADKPDKKPVETIKINGKVVKAHTQRIEVPEY